MKEQLLKFIKEKNIIQHGKFTLASGKESSFYIDGRKLTLDPEGLQKSVAMLLKEFRKVDRFHAVGGPSAGADPLIAAILLLYSCYGFMVRKEPKDHGTKQLIEGPVKAGMEVVIVEDTITSGGSALKAIAAAREYGLKVKAVGSIFFRGNESPFDVPFFHLFKVDDKGNIS